MIKLCECGCGQPTKIITRTHNNRGRIKGEYNKIIWGHQFKGKFRKILLGKDHPQWKGGITPLDKAIRNLDESKQWKIDVYKRDYYTCQTCGRFRKSGDRVTIHAHHKKEFAQLLQEFLQVYDQFSPFEDQHTLLRLATKYEPFWDVDNGETHCKECHVKIHNKQEIKI